MTNAPPDLAAIESVTQRYATAHAALADAIQSLEAEITATKRRALRDIRARVARAADLRAELHAAIDATPALWEKPRTRVFHGVKVGLQKGKGAVEFDDEAKLIARIERMYDEAITETLVKTSKKIRKEALAERPGDELKKLGVTVKDAGDQVIIKSATGDVEKMVDALLGDEMKQLQEAA